MKTWLKIILFIVLLGIVVNVFDWLRNSYIEEINSPDHEPGVIEGLTGKTAVDQYLKIEKKSDTFNLPALKTALMMFYTQHGRFPKNLVELEQSGEAGSEVTHDPFGNRYDMQTMNHVIILSSPGKDRIRGTTDDIEHRLKM